MAETSRGLPTGLPLLGMLLFLGASGIFLRPSALKQLRPPPKQPLWAESSESGRAASRLWQDPLQAIGAPYDQWRADNAKTNPTVPIEAGASFASRLERQREPWLVLVTVVSGSNYSDSESNRLDNRVAVVSALGESGFVPEDRETLGFFLWRPQDRWTVQGAGAYVGVPFEWFRCDAAPKGTASATSANESSIRNVLVLWLRSDALVPSAPLSGVSELTRALGLNTPPGSGGRPAQVVLLNTSSNRLIEIASEVLRSASASVEAGPPDPHPLPIRVVDWSATIAPRQLSETIAGRSAIDVADTKNPEALQEKVRASLESAANERVSIERHIGTDGELMSAIAHELAMRGVVPGKDGAHIAVVHEWDTAYGRALPGTLRDSFSTSPDVERELRSLETPDGTASHDPDRMLTPAEVGTHIDPYIHTYAYLQGVDGVLPVPAGDGKAESQGSPASGSGAYHAEAPEGRNQLDYIRRLAASMRWEESQRPTGERLRAIGVFGSLYDKVPVLQALRTEFPDALLFTTDLEARLVHASADGSLRNLLIASHYGLRADSKTLQPHVPPFRSSYQTSLFLAVRSLFPMSSGTDTPAASVALGTIDLVGPMHAARVYEVGRTGVEQLPDSTHRSEDSLRRHPTLTAPWTIDGWTLAGGGLAIAGAIILALYALRVRRIDAAHELTPAPLTRSDLLTALAATVLASIAVVAWTHFTRSGHPLATILANRGGGAGDTLVGKATSLVPDVMLLVATVLCGRLAVLAAMGRRATAPSKDPATWPSGCVYIGSQWFIIAAAVLGYASVMLAASIRLRDLDAVALWLRLSLSIGAFLVGFGLCVWSSVVQPSRVKGDRAEWSDTRRRVAASILPTLILAALVLQLVVAARPATWWWQALSILPAVLAIGGTMTTGIVFSIPMEWRRRREEWSDILSTRNWGMLATALMAFVVLCFAIERVGSMADQETLAIWEGTSAWPSIGLRIGVVVLGCWFLWVMRTDGRLNAQAVTRHWCLVSEPELSATLYRPIRWWPVPVTVGWTPLRVAAATQAHPEHAYGQAVWVQYLERARDYGRLMRVGLLALIFLALISPLLPEIVQQARAPYAVRGDAARWLHQVAYLASLGVLAAVTLTVWDVSNLCQRFIALLGLDVRDRGSQWSTFWHPDSLRIVTQRTGLRGEAAESYLTLQVIAERTRWVSSTIYYPFILIVVLLVAGAGGFDAWPQSWRVIVAILVPTLIAVLAARSLQSSAKRLRQQLSDRLGRDVGAPIPALTMLDGGPVRAVSPLDTLKDIRSLASPMADEVAASPAPSPAPAPAGLSPKARGFVEIKDAGAAPCNRLDLVSTDASRELAGVTLPDWVATLDAGWNVRCSIPLVPSAPDGERLVLTLARAAPDRMWKLVDSRRVALARITADDVKNGRTLFDTIRAGAFASYADNPLIRALLLPFGGFGAIQLVDYALHLF